MLLCLGLLVYRRVDAIGKPQYVRRKARGLSGAQISSLRMMGGGGLVQGGVDDAGAKVQKRSGQPSCGKKVAGEDVGSPWRESMEVDMPVAGKAADEDEGDP